MKPQNFNDMLAILYLPFLLLWVVMLALIIKFMEVSAIEALGLGTATGLLLGILGNIYQFYFRRAPPAPGDTSTTLSATSTTTPPNEPTPVDKLAELEAKITELVKDRTTPKGG